jgi:hypothetical protein
MADFINTVDILGDDAVTDSIIDRTITEFKDNTVETIGVSALRGCTELADIAFPNAMKILEYAFAGCTSLKAITPETFPKVVKQTATMRYAFENCTGLETVEWPSLEQYTGVRLFTGCSSLKSVDLPNVTTVDAHMFTDCTSLVSANMPKLTVANDSTFRACTALESVVLPSATALVEFSCFALCYALQFVDLPVCAEIKGSSHFQWDAALRALILRNTEAVCTLANTASFNGSGIANGTGYVYVPKTLVSQYASASNWSTFSAQFRALEDYTVDGTITGALDETKI